MLKIIFSGCFTVFVLSIWYNGDSTSKGDSLNKPIVGEYHSKRTNFPGRLWLRLFKNGLFTKSVELFINPDSTYTFITCGSTAVGKWQLIGDSLKLFCKKNIYNNDSLHKLRGELDCGTLPLIFVLRSDGSLYNERKMALAKPIPWYPDFPLVVTILEKGSQQQD